MYKKILFFLLLIMVPINAAEETPVKPNSLSPRALFNKVSEFGHATVTQLKKSLSQKSMSEQESEIDTSMQDDQKTKLTLTDAVTEGLSASVQLLLTSKADVNYPSETGETCLTLAAKYNRLEIARLLVSHKANVQMQNGYSQTPLAIAQEQKHLDFVAWLKELDAR
ncbi:MAG TPA: ankyrin repeat domain-containing protein [Candidatus Babeliales bacterium]|nr:ankyrin repeat domain-containing protein [Candidatus Babeliales bacterium]